MRALLALITLLSLSLTAFAVDETVTLRFLLKESVDFFGEKKKEVGKKKRGLSELMKLGLGESQKAALSKEWTLQTCREDAYGMLFKIASKYKKEDALSSSFMTRTSLDLNNDDLRSMFDFFIQPYLEFLNYKTDYLTAAVNKKDFESNAAMPYYLSEINVDGYCKKQADLKHYGQDDNYPEMELTLPPRIIVNDVARSKNYKKFEEIREVEEYIQQTQEK